MSTRLVIIGNGMAGLRLVEELYVLAEGRFAITVIGAEPVPAYNRVLLSALLAGDVGVSDIRYHDTSWYEARDIELRLGSAVGGIDLSGKAVSLENGESIPFDHLVFATGSTAIRLPIGGMDLDGVLTFRDVADVAAIEELALRAKRVAVIGGGLLGLEAAYGLAKAGLEVTVVQLADRLMERQLDPAAAAMLQRTMEGMGIAFRLGVQTTGILGKRHAGGVGLGDGTEIPADFVVVAVGILPASGLAKDAGIACGRGILIDDYLETSVPGIFAIGECAEHAGRCYGLVEPAYEQAGTLTRRLSGEEAVYAGSIVATNLKVSGVNVFSAGRFMADGGAEEVVLSDPQASLYRKLVFDGVRLVGAVLIGDTGDSLFYLDLIQTGRSVADIRADLIFGRALVEAWAA